MPIKDGTLTSRGMVPARRSCAATPAVGSSRRRQRERSTSAARWRKGDDPWHGELAMMLDFWQTWEVDE